MKKLVSLQFILFAVLLLNLLATLKAGLDCWQKAGELDEVVKNEARFANLCKELPEDISLGYVADGEVRKGNLLRFDSFRRFFLAQYSLVPRLLFYGSKDYDLVIGNFSSDGAAYESLRKSDLRVLKNFGNGLVLLRKQGQRSK